MTINFGGETFFNPGLPGVGGFSGQIVLDSDGVTPFGVAGFDGGFRSLDMSLNGVNIATADNPTTNRVTQVDLNGTDALLGEYEGEFEPTGESYEVESLFFDFRPVSEATNIFDDQTSMFDALAGGESFSISKFTFLRIVVRYVDQQNVLDTSILVSSNFGGFNVNVTNDVAAVPLPAGLPLMLSGLGGLMFLRRRQKGCP